MMKNFSKVSFLLIFMAAPAFTFAETSPFKITLKQSNAVLTIDVIGYPEVPVNVSYSNPIGPAPQNLNANQMNFGLCMAAASQANSETLRTIENNALDQIDRCQSGDFNNMALNMVGNIATSWKGPTALVGFVLQLGTNVALSDSSDCAARATLRYHTNLAIAKQLEETNQRICAIAFPR